jgi:hypothetical protein
MAHGCRDTWERQSDIINYSELVHLLVIYKHKISPSFTSPRAHYLYEDPCRAGQGKLDISRIQEAKLAVVELPVGSPKPDRPH